MPIHDWTRVDAGTYHDFHQGWTIFIRNALNRGVLPAGYMAMADQKVKGPEPDVVAVQLRRPDSEGGRVVADAPPRSKLVGKTETEKAAYARKANRIVIRHKQGRVVAAIEVVSPGNKDSKHAVGSFVEKAVNFIRNGIHFVMIDPFPPGPRDPGGLHLLIWDELSSLPFSARPEGKPLTVASFDAGDDVTAYVDPVAVGDAWPDAPLFLAPGWYVNIPLERTYQASWDETPQPIRDQLVDPPG